MFVFICISPDFYSSIHIFIDCNDSIDIPLSNVTEYISMIYSKVWDEMLLHHRLTVESCVFVNHPAFGFKLPEKQPFFNSLTNIFTFDPSRYNHCSTSAKIEPLSSPQIDPSDDTVFHYFDLPNQSLPTFSRVAVGGTFDRFHSGHRKLLTLAAAVCTEELIIGISGDALLSKKSNASSIASYPTRERPLIDFLSSLKPSLALRPVCLSDPFGPTGEDPSIEALVCSSETIPGARMINNLRRKKGMKPLVVLVSRRADTATLSSTFLRNQKE